MPSRWLDMLPSSWRGVNGAIALWQLPLILIFSVDPGPYIIGFWSFSYILLALKRPWIITPLLFAALGFLFFLHRPPSAEFFIGMLVLVLPLSWRPENDDQVLSPVGLPPTIFMVGSVFIFHIQFFVLLLIFIWLLGFLLWFSMTYAGWSLKDIQIRWLRLMATSLGASAAAVLIFALLPKIDTGAIPSFARSQDKIQLTDSLGATGFRSLLGDDSVAFRAFPMDGVREFTPYWRVYTLDYQDEDGWTRTRRRAAATSTGLLDLPHREFDIMGEGHDMRWLPVPGWAVPGVLPRNSVTSYGEVRSPRNTVRQGRVAFYDHTSPLEEDPRYWRPGTLLGREGELAEWARAERQRFDSDAEFADFLMDFFATNFRYSTTTNYQQDTSVAALDAFFFEGRSGYCSFFAQAMATALRANGIPAHVVTGYLGGTWNDFGGYWLVRNNMAHAWVEARLDYGNWKRFDPTLRVAPGSFFEVGSIAFGDQTAGQPQARRDTDGMQPRWYVRAGMWVDSLNTRITRSIMQYGGGNTSFKSRITGMDFETLIWILGGMMLAIVVVSGGSTLIRRMGFYGGKPGLVLERQFEAILEKLTGPRGEAEGLLAYTGRVLQPWEEGLRHQAAAIAHGIYAIRFGGKALDRLEAKRLGAAMRQLRQSMVEAVRQPR